MRIGAFYQPGLACREKTSEKTPDRAPLPRLLVASFLRVFREMKSLTKVRCARARGRGRQQSRPALKLTRETRLEPTAGDGFAT